MIRVHAWFKNLNDALVSTDGSLEGAVYVPHAALPDVESDWIEEDGIDPYILDRIERGISTRTGVDFGWCVYSAAHVNPEGTGR